MVNIKSSCKTIQTTTISFISGLRLKGKKKKQDRISIQVLCPRHRPFKDQAILPLNVVLRIACVLKPQKKITQPLMSYNLVHTFYRPVAALPVHSVLDKKKKKTKCLRCRGASSLPLHAVSQQFKEDHSLSVQVPKRKLSSALQICVLTDWEAALESQTREEPSGRL